MFAKLTDRLIKNLLLSGQWRLSLAPGQLKELENAMQSELSPSSTSVPVVVAEVESLWLVGIQNVLYTKRLFSSFSGLSQQLHALSPSLKSEKFQKITASIFSSAKKMFSSWRMWSGYRALWDILTLLGCQQVERMP